MNRALLWLLGGLALFVVVVLVIAPELLGDLPTVGGLVGVALAALLPALLVAAVFVSVRRRRGGDGPRPVPTDPRRARRDPASRNGDGTTRADDHTDPGA
jgi:hypothetical protein